MGTSLCTPQNYTQDTTREQANAYIQNMCSNEALWVQWSMVVTHNRQPDEVRRKISMAPPRWSPSFAESNVLM